MAISRQRPLQDAQVVEFDDPQGDGSSSDGGSSFRWLSSAASGVAILISGVSFYLSVLQGAALETYIPPTIQYGRDSDSEVFAIPVTIANDGARSTTVLSLELEVQNANSKATKRYYSAFLGEHPREAAAPNRQFAPLSIPGRTVFSETVRFYPAGESMPRVVDAQGEYLFRLRLNTATPPEPSLWDRLQGRAQPAPIAFQMTLPWLSEQHLVFRRATIAMHAKDWKPTVAANR